jgi:predicted transcriptional regulator
MEAPCQKIVWDVLPAIRAAIAVELVRHGVSQVEASRMLEIAPSAVSQYLTAPATSAASCAKGMTRVPGLPNRAAGRDIPGHYPTGFF